MMDRSPGSLAMLATAHARAGNRAEALRLIEELKQRRQKGYIPSGAFITTYLRASETMTRRSTGATKPTKSNQPFCSGSKSLPSSILCAATLDIPTSFIGLGLE